MTSPFRRGAEAMLASVAVLTLVACTGDVSAPAATAVVSRADISNGVSAVGSLSATTTQELGFGQGGQLTAVKVKVGDRVTKGQVLATIDDYAPRQALKQQKADLHQQEAELGRIAHSPAVSGAEATLRQARTILAKTRKQVSASWHADSAAIDRAEKQLRLDRRAEDQTERLLHQAESACVESPCSAVASAKLAHTAARQRVEASRTVVSAAQQQRTVDNASGRVLVETSRQGVVTAQNARDAAASDRPFNLDSQIALVNSAEAGVLSARRAVQDAVLRAPFDGTVSVINGVVGEFLTPSAGTTALAPGSGAAIPGSTSGGGAAAGALTPNRPGGTQFMVLTGDSRLQAVLAFEESDAARIRPRQPVLLGIDAIPDLVQPGTVVSVSPSGTAISGVISYYVTVRLKDPDPRLRDGQTARASVTTELVENVLSVPNAAVHQQGDSSTVVVVEADGSQRPMSFEAGVVGQDRTEVRSGLPEGAQVVVPAGTQ
jgi:HlyD family secretion protein